jgi:hypothetical protein
MRAGTGETELAFTVQNGKTTGHRLGSRLEVERRQTRSSNLGFRAYMHRLAVFYDTTSQDGLRAVASRLGL